MAHPFAVQDKFTQKTQDLNPECKEGSIPIMLLWDITGDGGIRNQKNLPMQFVDSPQ